MADDRIIVAIGRIERALSRLERIAESPAPTAQSAGASAPGHDRLVERHAALRAETESTIATLDRLIANLDSAEIDG